MSASPDRSAQNVSAPGAVTIFGAGTRKRLYVDRKAAAYHEPAIVLELESGERYRAERAEWNGKTEFVRDHGRDAKPALWVETDAEVTLI